MAYLTDTKPEEKSSPSQILLENGLVISFYIRYDHRSVHHYRKLLQLSTALVLLHYIDELFKG